MSKKNAIILFLIICPLLFFTFESRERQLILVQKKESKKIRKKEKRETQFKKINKLYESQKIEQALLDYEKFIDDPHYNFNFGGKKYGPLLLNKLIFEDNYFLIKKLINIFEKSNYALSNNLQQKLNLYLKIKKKVEIQDQLNLAIKKYPVYKFLIEEFIEYSPEAKVALIKPKNKEYFSSNYFLLKNISDPDVAYEKMFVTPYYHLGKGLYKQYNVEIFTPDNPYKELGEKNSNLDDNLLKVRKDYLSFLLNSKTDIPNTIKNNINTFLEKLFQLSPEQIFAEILNSSEKLNTHPQMKFYEEYNYKIFNIEGNSNNSIFNESNNNLFFPEQGVFFKLFCVGKKHNFRIDQLTLVLENNIFSKYFDLINKNNIQKPYNFNVSSLKYAPINFNSLPYLLTSNYIIRYVNYYQSNIASELKEIVFEISPKLKTDEYTTWSKSKKYIFQNAMPVKVYNHYYCSILYLDCGKFIKLLAVTYYPEFEELDLTKLTLQNAKIDGLLKLDIKDFY